MDADLIGLLVPGIPARQLANAMRRATYIVAPDVFNYIDFGSGAAFSSPY
jgi:hypothetical protein